jgi:hypothetical protein
MSARSVESPGVRPVVPRYPGGEMEGPLERVDIPILGDPGPFTKP